VFTLRRVILVLLLLISTLLVSMPVSHPAMALSGNLSALYVSPQKSNSSSSFSLNVNLNLSSADTVAGYDIYMRYDPSVLNATRVTLGNLFSPDRVINITECVNGNVIYGNGCNILDGSDVVHLDVAYIDGALSGPNTWTVFTVQFAVLGKGHSFFTLFSDPINCGESRSQGCIFGAVQSSSGFPYSVIHLTWDGVYSNDGLQAFFNVAPALLIVNNPVHFDASDSFNPKNSSDVLSYFWNFVGDSTYFQGSVTMDHTYTAPGNYTVHLLVTDFNSTSSVQRQVEVLSALGGLQISVKDTKGVDISQSVTLKLFNGSILVETFTRPAGSTAAFSAPGLVAGTYTLTFSGPGITSYSKQENVIAGWTTPDIVYLTIQQPDSNGLDLRFYLILSTILGSVGIAGFLLVRTRGGNRGPKRAKSARR